MQNEFFLGDAARMARENENFRHVIFTTTHAQLVLMSIPPGGEIGDEVHPGVDQLFVFVAGAGEAIVGREEHSVLPGAVVVVPAGTRHNFVTLGAKPLKLFTIYSPPQHAPGTIHRTKAEADAAEHDEHHLH